MKEIRIYNPLDTSLSLQCLGKMYEIDAKETKGFDEPVAKQWMEIYGFITRGEAKVEKKEEDKEVFVEKKVIKKK